MRGERVEVQILAVAGEDREVTKREALMEVVDDGVGRLLRTGPQVEHRNDFCERVNGEP
jgi:hypothetical protein